MWFGCLLIIGSVAPQNAFAAVGACCANDTACDTTVGEYCVGPNTGGCHPSLKTCAVATPTPIPTASPDCKKKVVGGHGSGCPAGYPNACTGAMSTYCCKDPGQCTTFTPAPTSPPAAGPTIEPYDPECPAATGTGIKTALGCIPTDAELFVAYVLPWAIGFGGGVAFLLGVYGAFLIATASGDPEKVQAGKELITSVVLGVAIIAFSVLILRTLGVDILGIFSG